MNGITIDAEGLGGIKKLRDSLSLAQVTLEGRTNEADHISRIEELIKQLDAYRPLGPDGKHGDRHTLFCGCSSVKKILERTPFQG